MTDQQAHKSALRRIVDGQRNDPHPTPFKAADNLEQLAHAIFEEYRELAQSRIIATPHRCEIRSGSLAETHVLSGSVQPQPCWRLLETLANGSARQGCGSEPTIGKLLIPVNSIVCPTT